MRSTGAAFATLLESDQLDLVVLVEIEKASGVLLYAIDALPRTWNSLEFAATSGYLEEIQESAERQIPALQLVLQNRDGVLGPVTHPASGGEDLRGRRVVVRQASRALLVGATPGDLVIEWTFFINTYSWIGREAVAFELGVFPAESISVPNRTTQGLRCRWIYKGAHCGSTSALPTCNKTVADCRLRFVGEPLRFGAFPTAADARALRID